MSAGRVAIDAWPTDAWLRPVSARPLAALRIGLPLLLLAHLAWISGDAVALFGAHGIVPWALTDLLRDPWIPALSSLATPLAAIGIEQETAVVLLLSIYAGSLLSLALGWHARLSAFLAWGLHLAWVTSGSASFYGVDRIASAFLFYLMVLPTGRAWTIGSAASSPTEETIPAACLRVPQLHLCVIYLAAGLHKALGPTWWSGEAIWQVVSQPAFRTLDPSWLASHPWAAALAGVATIAVEIGYPFLIWPRRTRKAWLAITLGLHLGIAIVMGLVFFSSVMALLSIALFLVPEDGPARSAHEVAALAAGRALGRAPLGAGSAG